MKNPFIVISISILCFILTLFALAYIVCPYKYDEQISLDGNVDITAKNLKPFSYSPQEELYMTNCVFIGWSYRQVYLIDSITEEEMVSFVSRYVRIEESCTFYAVWASDKDNNGIPDYDSKVFSSNNQGNTIEIIAKPGKYKNITDPVIVRYDLNGGSGFLPFYDFEISNGDWVRTLTLENAAHPAGKRLFIHLFGTDELCRDYFVRVMTGCAISLMVGIFASLIVLIIGTTIGSVSGYYGGTIDLVITRVIDIIYALPDMLVIILLSVIFDARGLKSMFLIFALLYWCGTARLVRSRVMSLRYEEYVIALKSMNASNFRIIFCHIIPNSMNVILVSAAFLVPSAIFTESFLSFIGMGVQAPLPSLGALASMAQNSIYSYPYKLFIPAIFIALIVAAFNLLGDGLKRIK